MCIYKRYVLCIFILQHLFIILRLTRKYIYCMNVRRILRFMNQCCTLLYYYILYNIYYTNPYNLLK